MIKSALYQTETPVIKGFIHTELRQNDKAFDVTDSPRDGIGPWFKKFRV